MMVAHLCQGDQALCTHSFVNLSLKFLDHVASESDIVSTNRSFPSTGTDESIKRMTLSRHRAIHLVTMDNHRAIHLIIVDNHRVIHLVTVGQSPIHPPHYSWTINESSTSLQWRIIESSTSLQLDNHRFIHLVTVGQ
ncbi:hypothetical protein KY290_027385 [Solanum tuberosum]|uniref:Uncharacterized protein n=1 Tax=Solanum tuberosum TaxID=4113 RepID=A0ABQ7UG45_SOLTU|nr:hypothetical protein KY290_027385 [Solanum tuberosum]